MVRSLKPHKLDPDDMLLLGINQRQLLSVVYLRAAEDSVSAPSDDAGYFLIALLAVQIDAQGQGIGRRMLDLALNTLDENRDRKTNANSWPTLAKIESTNTASQRLFRSRGLTYVRQIQEGLELWVHP
ncbi:GNAT family N-acetyltransferase [Nesterenkonia sphaerica]|uniref:GNAT family N-acetyltransferase n=1 Tax=Nesterenkonia sphaerica TaxID=1804988 RepID=A0A5R9AL62_9MICC|nr:GNAT family N-acetyltransferase [Nesterenkonia sphaerica]TLP79333.1 GNAT family N-acetyltransferase [Nesterenkonia sphaerica]